MTSIGLGSSNLWNVRAANLNLNANANTQKAEGGENEAQAPSKQVSLQKGSFAKVDSQTILANNGIKINTTNTQEKVIDGNTTFDSVDELKDAFANGRYAANKTIEGVTADGQKYVLKDDELVLVE